MMKEAAWEAKASQEGSSIFYDHPGKRGRLMIHHFAKAASYHKRFLLPTPIKTELEMKDTWLNLTFPLREMYAKQIVCSTIRVLCWWCQEYSTDDYSSECFVSFVSHVLCHNGFCVRLCSFFSPGSDSPRKGFLEGPREKGLSMMKRDCYNGRVVSVRRKNILFWDGGNSGKDELRTVRPEKYIQDRILPNH